jgi:hypothetical protein
LQINQIRAMAITALVAVAFGFTAFVIPVQSHAATTTHHKNWAQRHPTLTAVGAGIATHHALKVAARRDKARGKKLNWAERHPTMSAIGVGAVTHHIIKKTTH